jgi:hypothetical protein
MSERNSLLPCWALIYAGGYRWRWFCTSSRVGCSRWLQWVVPSHVRQKLKCLWIVLQLGRRLRDSWMASCWGRLGGGTWTCATFALQSKQLRARVISTEIVRTRNFQCAKCLNTRQQQVANHCSPSALLIYCLKHIYTLRTHHKTTLHNLHHICSNTPPCVASQPLLQSFSSDSTRYSHVPHGR